MHTFTSISAHIQGQDEPTLQGILTMYCEWSLLGSFTWQVERDSCLVQTTPAEVYVSLLWHTDCSNTHVMKRTPTSA